MPMEVVVGSVTVVAVPVVVSSVWVRPVLTEVVDGVMMAVVPVEVGVIERGKVVVVVAVVEVPLVGLLLPLVGVRPSAVLLSVMVDVIMVGLWGVIETESVPVLMAAVLPDMLVVVALASMVDIEVFMDVMVVDWPDTDNAGKRMPDKRKCRATMKPVLWERKKQYFAF